MTLDQNTVDDFSVEIDGHHKQDERVEYEAKNGSFFNHCHVRETDPFHVATRDCSGLGNLEMTQYHGANKSASTNSSEARFFAYIKQLQYSRGTIKSHN